MNYKEIARQARLRVLKMIYDSQVSHIGSNFSAIDIMAVLFDKVDINKDEVILSAGWKAASWYFFLWKKGIITEDELNSFCKEDSPFIGLVEPQNRWGLRCAGGSMGYGLPMGVGMALAKKINNEEGNVYVLMSDGELNCGTTWESALIASHHQLSNLRLIIDNNRFQAMGLSNNILNMGDILEKFHTLNWCSSEIVDGHNYESIERWFHNFKHHGCENPKVLIAKTTKGKGVSFMENNNLWHYAQIKDDDYQKALKELNV